MAMRYGSPALPQVLDELKARGVDRIVVLPAYPQYSGTTTASIWDAVYAHYARCATSPSCAWSSTTTTMKAISRRWPIRCSNTGKPRPRREAGDEFPRRAQAHADAGRPVSLRMPAHRAPAGGAPAPVARAVCRDLPVALRRAEWLQPYTAPTVQQLAREGVKRIDVMCPGFTSDCLETLEEINMEVRRDFETAAARNTTTFPA
jgi:ferrochelatase